MTEFDRQMTWIADEVMREVAGEERVSHDPTHPGYRRWVKIKKEKEKNNKEELNEI
ncbi:hypothetical protein LCGC14_2550330 [marine sediment metagenome]|uniref:Uncharacterized protein n=1 Tax=marine sediment metagenome TaxID=412755 RepID=A0A0F9BAY6_9ZZZZ